MLLEFRKIKKSLNFFNNCRSFIFTLLFCLIAIGAYWGSEIVFMLGKFKSPQFTAFQMATEQTASFEMLSNGGFDYIVSGGGFRLEPDQCVLEGKNKLLGRFIKIISPGKVFAEEMSSNATNERAKDTKAASNVCYFKGSEFQFYLYASIGGFTGIFIGVVLIVIGHWIRRILF